MLQALAFTPSVKRKYIIADKQDGLPAVDYPPQNIASMMKQCKEAGREDLAAQIQMQWGNVLNKYPATRVNWATAVKIGGASIKKNIFDGLEFGAWLAQQGELSPKQKEAAKKVVSIMPPMEGTPALAIPKDGETPEDWKEAAERTKQNLAQAKKSFASVHDYISFLEKEASELQKKIASYSKGGDKATTKDGTPHKYAAKVPKWEALLKGTLAQLQETKSKLTEAEGDFKQAVDDYNHAPLTTVAYEEKAQDSLTGILEHILDMKDLNKQRELLVKLNKSMTKQKSTASVEEVIASEPLFEKIKQGFKAIMQWISGLTRAVKGFGKIAGIRYA